MRDEAALQAAMEEQGWAAFRTTKVRVAEPAAIRQPHRPGEPVSSAASHGHRMCDAGLGGVAAVPTSLSLPATPRPPEGIAPRRW